jgi:hypothetical protein
MAKSVASLVGIAGLVFAAVGCGGKAAEPNVVEMTAAEYAFAMPERIEGGVVTMEFANEGREHHEYAFWRLRRNLTAAELKAAFLRRREEPRNLVEGIESVPTLSPGQSISITRTLRPGKYAVLCRVAAPDGRPHIAHGMVRTFTITGRSKDELPEPDAVVTATDEGIRVPRLEAGRRTIELRNEARDFGGFYLLDLRSGKTLEDVSSWVASGFKGEAPATLLGAMYSIPRGSSVFLTIELEAGKRYMFDGGRYQASFTTSD